jgi:hypothetical protein
VIDSPLIQLLHWWYNFIFSLVQTTQLWKVYAFIWKLHRAGVDNSGREWIVCIEAPHFREDFVCFLNQKHVRQALHVGNTPFRYCTVSFQTEPCKYIKSVPLRFSSAFAESAESFYKTIMRPGEMKWKTLKNIVRAVSVWAWCFKLFGWKSSESSPIYVYFIHSLPTSLMSELEQQPKNVKIVLEGKATCRLHRKSPNEYNANLCWTAGVTLGSGHSSELSRTVLFRCPFMTVACFLRLFVRSQRGG